MNHAKSTLLSAAFMLAALPLSGMADGSAGCSAESPLAGGIYSMSFDGLERTYRVHVPKGYDHAQPAPLIAVFHGWSGDESDYLGVPLVREEADQHGYIIVAPRGLGSGEPDHANNSWSFRGSNTGIDRNGDATCDAELTPDYRYPSCKASGMARNLCAWTHCQGTHKTDVEFVLALLEDVSGKLCVDETRIFATGSSNGGMLTWELAQNPKSASTFRAIAPNIGLPHRGYLDGPPAGAEMPAFLMTGTADATVPPGDWEDFGYTTTSDADRFYYASASAIMRVWANALGCSTNHAAAPVDTGVEEIDCRSYCSEDKGLPRVLDCRADMGHESGLSWSWGLTLDFFDAHGARD
jgi:polyhydroxybutyrate depolymerase